MSRFGNALEPQLLAELAEFLGSRVKVLTHGSGPEVSLLATRDRLVLRQLGQWRSWGWEQIASGSWRADAASFSWRTTSAEEVSVQLTQVGRLPELFKERIQASTVGSQTYDLEIGRVQLIGRRTLDGSDQLKWYVTASGGADLSDPVTAAFVVARTDQLKAEYGWS